MIQLLPCPTCQQPTVFPEGVTLEATVQCPHCHEQFVVGEMLTSRFSSWIVVHDPAPPHGIELAATSAATGDRALEANRSLDRDVELDTEPLELQAVSATPVRPKTDWSKFEPITHEQFERLRKKTRSPIWSLLQIVLGGVAAIPISLLLIWHLIGTDVAGAGPLVGRYLPWIVPAKFRPLTNVKLWDDEATPRDAAPVIPGASGFRRFDDVLDPRRGTAPTAPDAELNARGAVVAAETASNVPTAGEEATAGDQSNNVFALIQETIEELDAWKAAVRDQSIDQKKVVAPRLYNGLIGLSEAIAALPVGNPVLRVVNNKMDEIARVVKSQSDVQAVVRQGADFWLKKQAGAEPFSLALIVDVESVLASEQKLRLVQAASKEMTLGARPLAIEIPKNLPLNVSSGESYLLLGTVDATTQSKDQNGASSAPEEVIFTANYLYAL